MASSKKKFNKKIVIISSAFTIFLGGIADRITIPLYDYFIGTKVVISELKSSDIPRITNTEYLLKNIDLNKISGEDTALKYLKTAHAITSLYLTLDKGIIYGKKDAAKEGKADCVHFGIYTYANFLYIAGQQNNPDVIDNVRFAIGKIGNSGHVWPEVKIEGIWTPYETVEDRFGVTPYIERVKRQVKRIKKSGAKVVEGSIIIESQDGTSKEEFFVDNVTPEDSLETAIQKRFGPLNPFLISDETINIRLKDYSILKHSRFYVAHAYVSASSGYPLSDIMFKAQANLKNIISNPQKLTDLLKN